MLNHDLGSIKDQCYIRMIDNCYLIGRTSGFDLGPRNDTTLSVPSLSVYLPIYLFNCSIKAEQDVLKINFDPKKQWSRMTKITIFFLKVIVILHKSESKLKT